MNLIGNTEVKKSLIGNIHLLKEIHGYSAYEIAVKHGFKGTEKEWLASLKGEKGDIGTLDAFSELDLRNQRIINVAKPEEDGDAANRGYVKEHFNNTENPHEVTAVQVAALSGGKNLGVMYSSFEDVLRSYGIESKTMTTLDFIEALPNYSFVSFKHSGIASPRLANVPFALGNILVLKSSGTAYRQCLGFSSEGDLYYYNSLPTINGESEVPYISGWLKLAKTEMLESLKILNADAFAAIQKFRRIDEKIYSVSFGTGNTNHGASTAIELAETELNEDGTINNDVYEILGRLDVSSNRITYMAKSATGGSAKELFGEHNKPKGFYVGSGSATERTIPIGGTGDFLLIRSGITFGMVTYGGAAIFTPTGSPLYFTREQLNFTNGILTIATNSGTINQNTIRYYYQVV